MVLSGGLASTFPVIDIKDTDLYGQGRRDIIQQITKASEEYGFFQVKNHGVPGELMESMMRVGQEFFEMPLEHRAKFYLESEDGTNPASCHSLYLDKEKSFILKDTLRHYCNPLEDYIDLWPKTPEKYREIARKYCLETKLLAMKLYGLLSEALGLETCYIEKEIGKHVQMIRINYFPASTDPRTLSRIVPHVDPDALTLFTLGEPGLQIMKDGKWIDVETVPNAIGVYVGPHIQTISNGKFVSPYHRAILDSSVPRTSVLMFFSFPMEAHVAPAQSLVNQDNPARYRAYTVEEFEKLHGTIDYSIPILDQYKA